VELTANSRNTKSISYFILTFNKIKLARKWVEFARFSVKTINRNVPRRRFTLNSSSPKFTRFVASPYSRTSPRGRPDTRKGGVNSKMGVSQQVTVKNPLTESTADKAILYRFSLSLALSMHPGLKLGKSLQVALAVLSTPQH
jgi:hypothetical protein